MTLLAVCLAWVAVSIPLCIVFGRICGMYERCRYVESIPLPSGPLPHASPDVVPPLTTDQEVDDE